jgi:hypothetical protein
VPTLVGNAKSATGASVIPRSELHIKKNFDCQTVYLHSSLAQRIANKAHTRRRLYRHLTIYALGESPRTPCVIDTGSAETRRHRSSSQRLTSTILLHSPFSPSLTVCTPLIALPSGAFRGKRPHGRRYESALLPWGVLHDVLPCQWRRFLGLFWARPWIQELVRIFSSKSNSYAIALLCTLCLFSQRDEHVSVGNSTGLILDARGAVTIKFLQPPGLQGCPSIPSGNSWWGRVAEWTRRCSVMGARFFSPLENTTRSGDEIQYRVKH